MDTEHCTENNREVRAGKLKEWDYVCHNPLRQSAHRALAEEYKSASLFSKSDKLVLEQGLLIKKLGEHYCYLFDVSQLTIESYSFDKPQRFEINKKHVDGQVYSAAEGKVEVHLTESYGKLLHELYIIFDVCILLDLVDRRIVDIDRKSDELHSNFSHSLFEDLNFSKSSYLQELCDHNKNQSYFGLSEDQLKVVRHSLSNTFTLIWGPPGTGKSYTLLAVIAELLANGKTILFSSNTNSAIDNVLEEILKDNCPYPILLEKKEDAKIVRLGPQATDEIKASFSTKGLALTKSEEVRDTINKITNKRLKVEAKLSKWEEVSKKWVDANEIIQKHDSLKKKLLKHNPLKKIVNQIEKLNKYITTYDELENDVNRVSDGIITGISKSRILFKKSQDDGNATNLLLVKINKDIARKNEQLGDTSKKLFQLESSWLKKKFNKAEIERLTNIINESRSDISELNNKKEAYEKSLMLSTEGEVAATNQLIDAINNCIKYRRKISEYNQCLNVILINFNPNNIIRHDEEIDYAISFYEDNEVLTLLNDFKRLVAGGLIGKKDSSNRKSSIARNLNTHVSEKNIVSQISVQLKQIESKKNDALNYIQINRDKFVLMDTEVDNLKISLKDLNEKINKEEKKLEEIELTIINEADMLCLTMVKASYDKQIINRKFDILVVDEFSMVSLPQLYCVSGLVKEKIILCGDHLQLPPICQSDETEALKWMGNSFYEWHEGKIGSGNDHITGENPGSIKRYMANLETQRRMPSNISALIKPWYKLHGLVLKDNWVKKDDDYLNNTADHVLLDNKITILDTTKTNCYSNKSITKSRYNLVHAAIISYICKEFVENHNIDPSKIVCISPYKHQSSLIKTVAHQINPDTSSEISEHTWTIHKSQGRGGAIVIYDLTDGVEGGLSGFHKSFAPNLLNVAISRSKARLIIVCALDKMITSLNTLVGNPLRQVFERMSEQCVPVYDAQPYYKKIFHKINISDILSSGSIHLSEEQKNGILILTSHEYYKVLAEDIKNARKSLLIVSPFVTPRRMERIEPLIIQALMRTSNELRVEIITRPPDKMFDRTNVDPTRGAPVRRILDRLVQAGVKVTLAYNTHEKLVIIDEKISYWGSLNSLSFRDTDEINTRLEAKGLANKLLELAVQGRTESYKSSESENDDKIFKEGLIKIAEQELNQLAWKLAGFYKRPRMAFLYNKTINILINNPPKSWNDYLKIPELSRKNSVLRNHLDQLEDIIHILRGSRLVERKNTQNRTPKQGFLFPIKNKSTSESCNNNDVINRRNNTFKTLDKILKSGSKPDPNMFTFSDCKKVLIVFFDEMTQKSMKKDTVAPAIIKYLQVNTRGKPYTKLVNLFNRTLTDCISSGKLIEYTTHAGVLRIKKP